MSRQRRRNRRKPIRNLQRKKYNRAHVAYLKAAQEPFPMKAAEDIFEDWIPREEWERLAAYLRWKLKYPERRAWKEVPVHIPGRALYNQRLHHKNVVLTLEELAYWAIVDAYYVVERDALVIP